MSANPRKKIRLGDLLVKSQIITEAQLMEALATQKQSGHKLGKVLIQKGLVSEMDMLTVLSTQLNIPFVELKNFNYETETVKLIPETIARRYRAIAIKENKDGSIIVGMADPTDIFAFDELNKVLKRPIQEAVVREADLMLAIDKMYRHTEEISTLAEELGDELSESDFDLEALADNSDVVNAPVVKLLQTIFDDAIQVGASDIHIEPDENVLRIRQRIDGVLHEHVMKEKRISQALVSRLKLMSGLNISERRIPQDGRFNIRVKDKSIDVRLSTMPIQHGESVVMRLLDQSSGILELANLGLPEKLLHDLRNEIHRPYGLILITGPTGSGKTTTLYAALAELNNAEKKIITVEDPVEYRLPRINQVQVHPKIGLTFASVLRAALRQDPDIVLIGEMRDNETAEIGLRAAMTGHLVLSSLHTNDAVSSANRLLDLGAEGYLVATALRAIIAQRLIRKICTHCKEEHKLETNERSWLANSIGQKASQIVFHKGRGCHECGNSGYHGRVGVFELLQIDENIADALRLSDASLFAKRAKESANFRSFSMHALDYAIEGITSLEEVIRVAGSVEEIDYVNPQEIDKVELNISEAQN
ncbi:MAG: GspE/PulE family protein [Thiohalomonadales bacterium]